MADLTFRMALDSGAFGIYNKFSKRSMSISDSSTTYYESPEFKKYLKKYQDFLTNTLPKRNLFYVTVDALYQPQLTYDIWRDFKRAGFNPMPVVHYGEDMKWLKKYMGETDYLGIGGMGTRGMFSVHDYMQWADEVFRIISDSKGRPKWKTHGFALTQYDMLKRYAWHSVDSTTAYRASSNGMFIMPAPIMRNGKVVDFHYGGRPYWVPCTEGRGDSTHHINRAGVTTTAAVKAYLDMFGWTMDKVRETYAYRCVLGLSYYYHLADALTKRREYPFHLYISGRPSGATNASLQDFLPLIASTKRFTEFNYLGTFFEPATYLTHAKMMEDFENGNARSRKSFKVGSIRA